jgi:hypothetical protein
MNANRRELRRGRKIYREGAKIAKVRGGGDLKS